MAKTVSDKFVELENKFTNAKRLTADAKQQETLQFAIDSLQYIRGFFSGEYYLPSLEESADSAWGQTFVWIKQGYANIEAAERLVERLEHVQAQARSAVSAQPTVQPVKIKKQAQPAEPVQQAQPAKPVQQAQPAKPVQQAQPAKPVQQAQPAKPVQQAQPAKPVTETGNEGNYIVIDDTTLESMDNWFVG